MKASFRLRRLFVGAFAAAGLVVATLPAAPVSAQVGVTVPYDCQNGYITVHKDSNFNGEQARINPGLSWQYMVSGWNDVISSVCVPPGAYITLYQNSYFWGGSTTIDNRSGSSPKFWASMSWYWNDATSSFRTGR